MPTDEIFDDEMMNEMIMNPNLFGLEENNERNIEDKQDKNNLEED